MNNEIVGKLERSFQTNQAKVADENLRDFLLQQLALLDKKAMDDERLFNAIKEAILDDTQIYPPKTIVDTWIRSQLKIVKTIY